MKKYLSLILMLCLLVTFSAGCASSDAPEGSAAEPIAVDVDLTLLSSTMVYAEVFNIMSNPSEYIGKTIKMNGPYYAQYYDKTGLYYHYVIVEDATACCTQGIEFMLCGEHNYPDDYPEALTKIEVTGVFDSYEELGETYYYLESDEIVILG